MCLQSGHSGVLAVIAQPVSGLVRVEPHGGREVLELPLHAFVDCIDLVDSITNRLTDTISKTA
jgi:hypothetical protein